MSEIDQILNRLIIDLNNSFPDHIISFSPLIAETASHTAHRNFMIDGKIVDIVLSDHFIEAFSGRTVTKEAVYEALLKISTQKIKLSLDEEDPVNNIIKTIKQEIWD